MCIIVLLNSRQKDTFYNAPFELHIKKLWLCFSYR